MLMLYTLSPGSTSAFKDVRLCEELCPGTETMEPQLSKIFKSDDINGEDEVIVISDPLNLDEYAISALKVCLSLSSLMIISSLLWY